jgi:hypothetical protein
LYFLEKFPKQLHQDEILEILHQAKAPEWHEAKVSFIIDIFAMSHDFLPLKFGDLGNKNNHNTADCRAIIRFKQ